MKRLLLFIFAFSLTGFQKPFSESLKGVYTGTINSFETGDRKLLLVITEIKSYNGFKGFCVGYTTVNTTNKTFFSGNFSTKATGVSLNLYESGSKQTDGVFNLYTCPDPNGDYEYLDNSFCGKWKSYDGEKNKSVMLRKK